MKTGPTTETDARPPGPVSPRDRGIPRYFAAVRSSWVLIVVLVAAATVGAVVYVAAAPARYQAGADILVTPVAEVDPAYVGIDVLRDSGTIGSSVITAATVAGTPPVTNAAAARLHVPPATVRADVQASPLTQSNIVVVVAQSSSGARAAAMANAVASAMVSERTSAYAASVAASADALRSRLQALGTGTQTAAEATAIQQRLAELASLPTADPSIRVLSPAIAPTQPTWPRKSLIFGAALLVALLIGFGLAIAREFLTQTIRSEQELVAEQRLPVLGRIPLMPRGLAAYVDGRGPLPAPMWESYRSLRSVLVGIGLPRSGSILIASAAAGEGKTTTAINLAVTMAQGGARVVVVDADLYRPMIASMFGVPAHSTEVVLVPGFDSRLGVLATLPDEARHATGLDARGVRLLLAALGKRADVIVIDGSPITEVADTLDLASAADLVLLSVKLGTTRRDRLDDARRMLSLRGVRPAGMVVTVPLPRQVYRYEARPWDPSTLVQTLPAAAAGQAADDVLAPQPISGPAPSAESHRAPQRIGDEGAL